MGYRREHLAMLLFSVLVAGSFSLGSMVANEISPAALNTVRFLIAGLLVGGVAMMTTGIKRSDFAAPWRYLLLGGLFAGYFVLMFEGLKTATPVGAAAVFTLTPILSAGFGYLLLRQITTARMALALSIGAVGALWVIFRADIAAFLQFRIGSGEMIYFWGCVMHALYTPMVRKFNCGEAPVVFTFGVMVAGFFVLLVYGGRDVIEVNWASLSAMVWVTILYVSIAASSITFVLLQFAVLRLPASKVMAYTYLVPSWVILWEVILGHGTPHRLVFWGVGLTVIALWMLLKDET